MAWWNKVFGGRSLRGRPFRLSSTLYSLDGNRSAALLDFGVLRGTYIREQETDASGAFADRFHGALVGPFRSPAAAERFIVGTAWFNGRESS